MLIILPFFFFPASFLCFQIIFPKKKKMIDLVSDDESDGVECDGDEEMNPEVG